MGSPHRRQRRSRLARPLTGLLGLAGASWCAAVLASCAPSVPPPVSFHALSLRPQLAYEGLLSRYRKNERGPELANELRAHERLHAIDPSAIEVRGLSVIVLIDEDRGEEARALIKGALFGVARGETGDRVTIASGALLRREGNVHEARRKLHPLFGKVADPRARELLNRELTLAALEEKDFENASKYLRAWLTEASGPFREEVERRLLTVLPSLSEGPMLDLLNGEAARPDPDRWLVATLTEVLSGSAIARQDAALARALLRLVLPLGREQTEQLSRIAARGDAVRIERSTVGLLMPKRDPALVRRAIKVADGLAQALGIPPTGASRSKLLIRDDQGDLEHVEESLGMLSRDGAAVLVAGFTREEAGLAVKYAQASGAPLLLVKAPPDDVALPEHVFVLGEPEDRVLTVLEEALLSSGKRRIVVFREEPSRAAIPSGVIAEEPCGALYGAAIALGASAVVIDGPETCVDVPKDRALPVAFGFDGPDQTREGFSFLQARPKGAPADFDWWFAIGHDAGALVKSTIDGLPSESGNGEAALAIRRRLVSDGIAHAEADLQSTDRRGFAGTRKLDRELEVAPSRASEVSPVATPSTSPRR